MKKKIKSGLLILLTTTSLLQFPSSLSAQLNKSTQGVSTELQSLYSFQNLPVTDNKLIDDYFAEYSSHGKKQSSKNKNQPLRDNFGLNYIAFSIGPSAPLGRYSQGTLDTSSSNIDVPPSALLGLQLSIDWAFYFNKHFGISAMAGYSFHPFDTTEIDNAIDYSPYTAKVTAHTYNNLFFFVGPCFGTGNEDVFFEVRAMFGLYHSSAFNLDIKQVYDTTYYNELKYTAPGSTQIGILIGADLRYKLNPYLALMFKTDFIFSSQHYPMTVTEYLNNNGVSYPPVYAKISHNNGATQVAPSIGIAYILNTESPKPQGGSQQGQPSKKGSYYYN